MPKVLLAAGGGHFLGALMKGLASAPGLGEQHWVAATLWNAALPGG